jgi:hypothetical protein
MTAAEFRARYPEFTSASDALVLAALAEAEAAVTESVWGALYTEGLGLRAAMVLASSPQGRQIRIKGGDRATIYERRFRELTSVVACGKRFF